MSQPPYGPPPPTPVPDPRPGPNRSAEAPGRQPYRQYGQYGGAPWPGGPYQPGPPAPPPPPPSALPVEPQPYFHFLRTPRHRWWKALLVVVAAPVAYFVLSLLATVPVVIADLLSDTPRIVGPDGTLALTPALFLSTNIGLALLIPAALLLQWAIYGQRPRWLHSVEGRFRWKWAAISGLVLVPVYLIYIGSSLLLDGSLDLAAPVNADALPYLIIILLTTPLQCAGEEYAVRGLMTRGVAAWIARPVVAFVVAGVVTGLVFTAGHPGLDPWKVLNFVVYATSMSALCWRTGGIETAVVAHTLNNMLIMIPTALWGDMSSALFGETPGSGLGTGVALIVAVVSIVGVELLARRTKLIITAAPGAAVGAPGPVPPGAAARLGR